MAHIYALAGVAGVNYGIKKIYDYGVDGQFTSVVNRGSRRVDTGFPLDFQAKATINWELIDGNIVYDLEAKTYNDLAGRTPAESTMVLILLCLPKSQNNWHTASYEETVMRHCCYWHTITGEQTTNTSTQRIYVPYENLLTPVSLNQLLAFERERRERQSA